jgi:hypothetical protein
VLLSLSIVIREKELEKIGEQKGSGTVATPVPGSQMVPSNS